MQRITLLALAMAVLTLHGAVQAEQPIFDEMPRWKGGWGVQFLQEFRTQQGLYDDDLLIDESHRVDAHLFHVQGVYTWDKSIRLTLKLPFVLHAQRTVETNGTPRTQQAQGPGDPTIGLPLKKYFNLDGRTGNWGITPQVKIPTAKRSEFDLFHREFGAGVTVGYGTETYHYLTHAYLTGYYFHGDVPGNLNLYVDLGSNYNLGSKNGHIKVFSEANLKSDLAWNVALGTIIYYRITDLVHAQLRTLHDLHRRTVGQQAFGRQDSFRLGIAFVF